MKKKIAPELYGKMADDLRAQVAEGKITPKKRAAAALRKAARFSKLSQPSHG